MPNIVWQYQIRVLTVALLGGWGSAMGPAASCQETALDQYVAQPDASYRWDVIKTIREDGLTTFVVDLKSQTWRRADEVDRTRWQHWLVVARPDGATADTALLFLAGGTNGGDPPDDANDRVKALARGSRSVVAALLMVPNQPLIFQGDGRPRVEDDLVAYTWAQFFRTGDPTWPAQNPMVKSAARAMDTVTALLASPAGGQMNVDRFVVSGASKRGWTAWLTGAVDPRVVAVAPIVIDVLNIQASMRHHYRAYGFWAPAVGDYTRQGIFQWMGTADMDALQQLVDPYAYRPRLQMPKFILNATGDQFFLPDSSRFYFAALPGEKFLRYVPNANHSLDDTDATESLLAFYLTVLHNVPRPHLTWTFEPDGAIRAVSPTPVARATLWQATNPAARDFRVETLGKRFRGSALTDQGGGVFVGRVDPPNPGWTAYFIELTYDIGQRVPLKLTTAVRISPDTLPFATPAPLAP